LRGGTRGVDAAKRKARGAFLNDHRRAVGITFNAAFLALPMGGVPGKPKKKGG